MLHINPPKHSQNIEADAKHSNTETRCTNPKKKVHRDHQIKEVRRQYHQKYIPSKISIPENVIPTTSQIEIDTTASSPSNLSSVVTPNSKLKIQKWSRNTILITSDSVISGIDEKRLSKKYFL